MTTNPLDEPFEEPFDISDDVKPGTEESRRIFNSPAFRSWEDRRNAEVKSVTDHAENWLTKTQHLHTPEQLTQAQNLIKSGRMGLVFGKDIDFNMDNIFKGVYPKFSFSDVPNNIPDHLGPQFKE